MLLQQNFGNIARSSSSTLNGDSNDTTCIEIYLILTLEININID